MKPVPPQPIRFRNLLVNRIRFHRLRHGIVEQGIEERDALHVGDILPARADDFQR